MAEDQVIAALSDMSLSKHELPSRRLDFPLPRELRDQIYGYLLDTEYNRVQRKAVGNRNKTKTRQGGLVTYKFHTNILAVSKAIHNEAEELMYKRNIFVVLSCQWPSPGKIFGGLLWLRLVSQNFADRMQLHSLHIHLTITSVTKQSIPVQSCIILASDLEAFSCVVRAAAETRPGRALDLEFAPGGASIQFNEPWLLGSWWTVTFLCDLRTTCYRSMDMTLQHHLLAPLASMTCTGQEVVIKGDVLSTREVEDLKRLMSPSLVWTELRLLSELRTLIVAKDIADTSLEQDELGFVLKLYQLIADRGSRMIDDEASIQWALQHRPEFVVLLETMVLELMVNIAGGKLKMRDIDGFETGCLNVSRILWRTFDHLPGWSPPVHLPGWSPPVGIVAYYHILDLWRSIYCGKDTSVSTVTVGEEVSRLERFGAFPHQAHDLAILRNHPDQQATLSADVLPLARCSISQLQSSTTSFYKTVDSLKLYTQSKAWYEFACLTTLDDQTKAEINNLQTQHGLQLTDFDLL